MLLAIPIFLPTHLIMGRDGSIVSVLNKLDHMEFNLMQHYLFCILYFVFARAEMMRSDKTCTASPTFIHVLSFYHLYPLPVTQKIQMRTFKRYFFSPAILLTTLHLKEMN
jgi:hypothetical protein